MSSTGVRPKRTPFDIAIESLRDTNSADIERMKMFSAESSPISGNVGASSTNNVTPGGSFLNIAGQTPMIGAIAFNPVTVSIVDGSIDIGASDVPPQKYSSYVLVTGQGTPDDLNYIDNALNNGQLLYYQGTISQIQNIKHASIGSISNIVGTTTVTVTTTIPHNMTTGDRVSIQSTTNFDISKATITVTSTTIFTYAATGSATPETSGTFQNGNVLTADGTTVVLDGTTAANTVPWIALLFDPTVAGGGAWRVQFGAGASGGGGGGGSGTYMQMNRTSDTMDTSNTVYTSFAPYGSLSLATSEPNINNVVPTTATLKTMYIDIEGIAFTGSYDVTVRRNDADLIPTKTVNITTVGTHIISDINQVYSPGDFFSLQFVPNSPSAGATLAGFSAEWEGGGTGLSEPIILGINTLTPQTSPTVTPIAWNTKNPQHITIDRNITFSFTNLPTTGSYEGILVIIDIDGIGGYDAPIWPASVLNPPTVPTTASTRTSVMLYTIDGGTIVTHATSVGSSSSGGTLSGLTIDVNKDWAAQGISNFGPLTGVTSIDLNGATALIQGVKEIRFFDDDPNKNIQSAADELSFNVPALDQFSFYADAVEMIRIIESAAGVYRLDLLDHSIVSVQDVRLDDTSGAVVFAGTDPAIGFDSVAARLIINYPTGASIFVTENNTIGTTVIKTNSMEANIVTANDLLQIGVDVTVPTVPGELRNDGTDVFVFSGSAVRNMSNIGVAAGGADVFLSNLSSPTSINQDLIPQSGKLLGSDGSPWSSTITNKIRIKTAGTFTATENEIIADAATGMEFNTLTGDLFSFFFNGGTASASISVSQMRMNSGDFRGTGLNLDDFAGDPIGAGEFRRNSADVKVFSGGSVRNLSDIGSGSFLPLGGGTMSGAINMGNNNIIDANQIQVTGPSGDTIRGFLSGVAGEFIINSNENSSQVTINTRNSGGTLTTQMTIEETQIGISNPLIFTESDAVGGSNVGIGRLGDDLELNTPTGQLIVLRVNNQARFSIANAAWGGQTGDDFRLFCVSSGNKAPLNLEPRAGDPTTTSDGDKWYNSTSNKYKGKENGTIVTFTTT